jgi:hypothetical protein
VGHNSLQFGSAKCWDYPKLDNLKEKVDFTKPSKLTSKPFIFALKDSAEAFVLGLSK